MASFMKIFPRTYTNFQFFQRGAWPLSESLRGGRRPPTPPFEYAPEGVSILGSGVSFFLGVEFLFLGVGFLLYGSVVFYFRKSGFFFEEWGFYFNRQEKYIRILRNLRLSEEIYAFDDLDRKSTETSWLENRQDVDSTNRGSDSTNRGSVQLHI